MIKKPLHIAIGLCTYKRPSLLQLALQSLDKLNLPDNIQITVIVVDNDFKKSAQSLVQKAQKKKSFPIEYHTETQKGIPFARNKIIEKALLIHADAIAYLDDDGQAHQNWLIKLLDYYRQGKEMIVTGPQHCLLPKITPDWAKKSEFFQALSFPSGTSRPWAATHNVLFPIVLVKDMGLRFDTNFLIGTGEDQLFFMEAVKKGMQIIWVEEAEVWEKPTSDRISIRWVLLRNFKYSSQGNRLYRKLFGWQGSIQAVWKGILYLSYASTILIILGLISMIYDKGTGMVKALSYFVRGVGWLAGFGMKLKHK